MVHFGLTCFDFVFLVLTENETFNVLAYLQLHTSSIDLVISLSWVGFLEVYGFEAEKMYTGLNLK
jgi:hypothetical protein